MDDPSRRMFRRINIPQFLEPDTISLGLAIRLQIELPLQNFGEMTTYALRKEGIFRVQFQSWLIIGLVAAITGNAHIAGSDALYRTIFVIENLCGCETGENLYARSEEHTSELQSLMRISYAVFCLKKTTKKQNTPIYKTTKKNIHITTQ